MFSTNVVKRILVYVVRGCAVFFVLCGEDDICLVYMLLGLRWLQDKVIIGLHERLVVEHTQLPIISITKHCVRGCTGFLRVVETLYHV